MSTAAVDFDARTTAADVLRGIDLTGRVVLVTGATSGIGLETARAVAAAGARVYVGGRSPSSANEAVATIQRAHPHADARPFVADLGSMADALRAGQELPEPELHALIANAGRLSDRYESTTDGLEATVGVCHFGHAALVRGLLPKLLAGAPARVVMVSSESHRGEKKLDPEHPDIPREQYRMMAAYDRAKLCNVLYANELDRRFADRGLRANSLHPGTLVATGIGRRSWLAWVALLVYRPFAKSLAQAAATSVLAAVHPSMAEVGGAYLVDCQIKRASRAGCDAALAGRLWEHTESVLDQVEARAG